MAKHEPFSKFFQGLVFNTFIVNFHDPCTVQCATVKIFEQDVMVSVYTGLSFTGVKRTSIANK